MKKGLAVLAVVLGIGLGSIAFAGYWGHGRGGYMMGPGYGGGYGGYMMGPGYGGGMMGPGYGGYCRNAPGAYGEVKATTEKEAKSILGNYVGTNPNLKVGKITDKDTYFEAEIRTKEDSLVAKLAVDKTTGWVRPLY
ncbi:MAG: hypothetical protein COW04_07410 [Deltaproteobacteria bacterium CG12_big_fil_rev_8_21_14_0_65_43_10]|nr:MAG: hypothetical protein AUK23_02755 [Deltaproteobacteria bacterium CG2_30_43_15]PIQ45490.1 MAG: hypothetical protein COW04_07410 [Deltaproteobacteria bacterium CG12_big_fil_rev_8_21_14_0_65_43_10]PIU85472.1 MAG: hypothetical protein COS67_07670 [Deltaproteobacteria bacterium CG06_land_8_20_14_3_00_44_19]PIX23682.1 MAG: hypothetical protein COZ68_08645 [Deltaproteobacteria bacterium CG_4_8_14_3_um_filter_43_13]PIZ19808.1 MAG: hypothetical protein COY50_08105 [Deltaproteobacteria bacterium C